MYDQIVLEVIQSLTEKHSSALAQPVDLDKLLMYIQSAASPLLHIFHFC